MLQWFFYDDAIAESQRDSDGHRGGDGLRAGEETKGEENRRQGGRADSDSETDVAPLFDDLDPTVTAAILAQAAFRGYRLRDRLRRLPAREAEKTIRALQANARGFRRLGLYLVFFALYFSLVFGGADVAFQRSVHQGLRSHLEMVKFGPEGDRSHTDVTSLTDVYQWMQMFYLKTYHGTQVESLCTACIVKPSDDFCATCDFDLYEANLPDSGLTSFGQGRRRAATSSGDTSGSSSSGTTTSSSSSLGLSKECQACVVGTVCDEDYVQSCAAFLEDGYTLVSDEDWGDVPDDLSSASTSSSASSISNSSVELTLNATALDAVVLEPVGGVTAAGGFLLVENASQCEDLHGRVGITENLGRFQLGLKVPYSGIGYVANRNRIIGGMLVKFSRRNRLSIDQCSSSRGYFDICLADGEDKETIVPGGEWFRIRPEPEIVYSDIANGYPILIDTGGFNTGLNMGLCTLMLMEDLEIIPQEEVKKVSVQLITYNGNQKSAYGSISIDFNFADGGDVGVTETIQAYVLKNLVGASDRRRWVSMLVFVFIFIGMARYDMKKWFRSRRSKAKRNRCHCVCGFCFFLLIFTNILLWMTWSFALTSTISFETDFQISEDEAPALDTLAQEIVALYNVAGFVALYSYIFVLTTMAGLYRWIFQMLTFHKRMSIVTETLSRASTHLDHFLFVIILVVLVFSNLTWLLVGSSTSEFSTLENAWQSVIRVTLGESENFYPQILAAQPSVGPVIVVLYQVLGVVLLLNVVIAVLLEAYRGVVGDMYDEDTIFESFTAFIGMSWCMLNVRIYWAGAYVRWWLDGRMRQEKRPSLKVALQGSTGVYGVDGRPVLMVRRSDGPTLTSSQRHLSYNCRRYITVTEMQALIEAAPVPAFVADRLVRKIVNNWVFRSTENNTREKMAATYSGGYGASSGSRDGSMDSMPMLRKRDSQSFGSR